MPKTSESVKEELKRSIFELADIAAPLTREEKILAKKAADILTEIGGKADTRTILQELKLKGLTEEALFFALKSGEVSFHNKTWRVKAMSRRCTMDIDKLAAKLPRVVGKLQDSGDYPNGVSAGVIKQELEVEDISRYDWKRLITEALETSSELRMSGKGAGSRYFCDVSTETETEVESDQEEVSEDEPVDVTEKRVSLFDSVLDSVTEFRAPVNIVLEGSHDEKISHTTPDDETEGDVAKLRWVNGEPRVEYHGLAFGTLNGKFAIFRNS